MTPDEFTNQEFFLDVGGGHRLYVHDWGKKNAKTPIIFLHGGPGNGCDNRDKQQFDPKTQRVIFHDQRGAGKSTPTGSLDHNTTPDLVEDINRITDRLNLDKLILIGSSWGTTLALAYGVTHPDRVAGMILDGVFTASKPGIGWLQKGGWRTFFPDLWQEYAGSVPDGHRADPSAYHLKRALGGDPEAAKKSAYEYEKMELALLKLDVLYQPGDYETYDPSVIKTEMHFTTNNFFLPENHIMKHAAKLTMPVYLIGGRYDMVCPPEDIYNLHEALPNSKLIWTINGHLKQHEAKNVVNLLLDQLAGED